MGSRQGFVAGRRQVRYGSTQDVSRRVVKQEVVQRHDLGHGPPVRQRPYAALPTLGVAAFECPAGSLLYDGIERTLREQCNQLKRLRKLMELGEAAPAAPQCCECDMGAQCELVRACTRQRQLGRRCPQQTCGERGLGRSLRHGRLARVGRQESKR